MKLRYKLAAGGFVGLLVFLVAVAGLIQWSGQRALDREIDLVVAAGGARDFSAFADLDIPDDENAALAWLDAFRALDTFDAPASGLTNDEVHDAWSDETLDNLGPAMKARRQVFELADAAAGLDRVRWPIDYTDLDSLFGSGFLGGARRLARFLVIDAAVAISEEDWERADRSLAAALALSEDVADLPLLINALVAFSIDGLIVEQLESTRSIRWQQLPLTTNVLVIRDYRGWLSRAFLGEVVFALDYDWDQNKGLSIDETRWQVSRFWRTHDLALSIRRLRELSVLAGMPFHQSAASMRDFESYDYPWVYPISEVFFESASACIRAAARAELQCDLAVWAAVLDHESRVAEPPIDVLTGEPLKSWPVPQGGWVVWSVVAETPEPEFGSREQMVWSVGTSELPPELQPFADELRDD